VQADGVLLFPSYRLRRLFAQPFGVETQVGENPLEKIGKNNGLTGVAAIHGAMENADEVIETSCIAVVKHRDTACTSPADVLSELVFEVTPQFRPRPQLCTPHSMK